MIRTEIWTSRKTRTFPLGGAVLFKRSRGKNGWMTRKCRALYLRSRVKIKKSSGYCKCARTIEKKKEGLQRFLNE